MTDQCSNCFYGKTWPPAGGPDSYLSCARRAPNALSSAAPGGAPGGISLLPTQVAADYWCGAYSATDPNIYNFPAGPPTPGTCDDCFFALMWPIGAPGSYLACAFNAPEALNSESPSGTTVEPTEVDPGYWCGQFSITDPSIYTDMIGPTGPAGPTGATGPTGPTGATGTGFSTGDVKLTIKTVADAGWVMMNDGTIGSASSGASTRANADTQNLFNLLYTNIIDIWAPLFTSAGVATTRAAQGSEATAWANNCQISLTKALGRAFAVAGAGAGLTPRALGQTLGEEAHTQTIDELVSHGHYLGSDFDSGSSADFDAGSYYFDGTNNGHSTASSGSGQPFNVMQPTSFLNAMIML